MPDHPLLSPATRGAGSGPWLILALLTPMYVLTMFYRMAPSILAPSLAEDFGVSVAGLAGLSGATFMTYGLMQLPSGLLADALGGRRTVCLITLLAGVGNLWFAAASGVESARFARFLVGVGSAVCVPCVAMLAFHFPPALFSRVNGLFLAAGAAGTVLAGAPLALASGQFGWRAVMAACGLLSLACAGLVWLLARLRGQEDGWGGGMAPAERARGLARGLALVLRTRAFRPLCLWYSLMVGLYFSMGGLWWGPYLIQGCGMTERQAGAVVSVACLIALFGQPGLAMLSERFRTRKKILVGCTLAALASAGVLSLFGAVLSPAALTAQGVFFTVATGMSSAVTFASVREMFPLRVAGTAIGCLQTLPYLLMTPLIQKAFGLVLELRTAGGAEPALAYAHASCVNIVAAGLALAAILRTRETFRSGGEG